ncbi:hypothetical protein K376_03910 [Streptomyces sp. PsTaAH-130]|nr:hypothetical protein K376_03910 [Streptomyces sp. PsTaAH-130]
MWAKAPSLHAAGPLPCAGDGGPAPRGLPDTESADRLTAAGARCAGGAG